MKLNAARTVSRQIV